MTPPRAGAQSRTPHCYEITGRAADVWLGVEQRQSLSKRRVAVVEVRRVVPDDRSEPSDSALEQACQCGGKGVGTGPQRLTLAQDRQPAHRAGGWNPGERAEHVNDAAHSRRRDLRVVKSEPVLVPASI